MGNLDISKENMACLSSKAMMRKGRRRSVLSIRKHFRKSIPNKSMSIIEISSTDCESLKSTDSSASINELEIQNPKSPSLKDISDSQEIISPSPKKSIKQLNCLSTGKKKPLYMKHDNDASKVQDTSNKKKSTDVCSKMEEHNRNLKAFLEFSILDYDQFRNPKSLLNPSMNSTMIQPEENKHNPLDIQNNFSLHKSVESVNKSFENLLDDLYGDSWRPYREKILPPSERKPTTKKIIVEKKLPATERKAKQSEIYKNPYVENEKHKSNNLLRGLHTKRIREAIESPFIQNLKALCDEESSEKSDVAPSIPRVKLCFDENEQSPDENEQSPDDKECENFNGNDHPVLNNDIGNFCWSDEENSLQKLPLKDRLEKKLRSKEKNSKIKKNDQSDVIINKNLKYVSPDRNEFESNANTNRGGSKKGTLSLDVKADNKIPLRTSSSGFSSESNNEEEEKNIRKVNKKAQQTKRNRRNYEAPPSSSDELIQNLEVNVRNKVEKRVTKKSDESCSNPSDSNDDIEVNKGVPTHQTDPTKLEDSPNYNEDIVKKITKKLSKTKISSNYNTDSKVPGSNKSVGKVNKKVLRTRNKQKKYFSENSSDSDDSLVEGNKKSEIKKNELTKMYSFLASLSNTVPGHQCDPRAKIFKANFIKNRESLAKELFQLFNKNVFDNLIPESVPLEWNPRMLCTAGYCYSKKVTHRDGKIDWEARIVLSTKVLTTADRLRDTLIHEMCHAATWMVDNVRDGHGKFWKAWATKARKVYPELPPIKTCHNYEISSKYVYKCTSCGYEIKRHRKSIDIERKRCGYCCGKFEIFMNKVNKKGEQNLVLLADTPKKEPKGFAAFYQENYANYKSPNTTPAQVMKLLSSKFKEMKVQ